jgi:hypothetical protein
VLLLIFKCRQNCCSFLLIKGIVKLGGGFWEKGRIVRNPAFQYIIKVLHLKKEGPGTDLTNRNKPDILYEL